jgi:hypothetical protein
MGWNKMALINWNHHCYYCAWAMFDKMGAENDLKFLLYCEKYGVSLTGSKNQDKLEWAIEMCILDKRNRAMDIILDNGR